MLDKTPMLADRALKGPVAGVLEQIPRYRRANVTHLCRGVQNLHEEKTTQTFVVIGPKPSELLENIFFDFVFSLLID